MIQLAVFGLIFLVFGALADSKSSLSELNSVRNQTDPTQTHPTQIHLTQINLTDSNSPDPNSLGQQSPDQNL